MSLSNPTPVKQFNLGLVVSRSFDHPALLDELFGPHLEAIGHVYSNGALPGARFVEDWCRMNGLTFTVYPCKAHAFKSVSLIIEASDSVYVITEGESKVASFAANECALKERKHRMVTYDPVAKWREAVGKANEIVAAQEETPENRDLLAALGRVLK